MTATGGYPPPEETPWFRLARDLHDPLEIVAAESIERATQRWEPSERQLPALAVQHFHDCVVTGLYANAAGRHAVGLALARQSIEALAIVELGLLGTHAALGELKKWEEGRRTHGTLRRFLERESWPTFEAGLWSEPWAEFQTSLARAVQPYSHCSPELLNWHIKLLSMKPRPNGDGFEGLAYIGPAPDVDKGERIMLISAVAVWTLGRMVTRFGTVPPDLIRGVTDLGSALAESRWFFPGEDWSVQLGAHVWFKEGGQPDRPGESSPSS